MTLDEAFEILNSANHYHAEWNPHNAAYESVADYMSQEFNGGDDWHKEFPEVAEGTNLARIQLYPDTPIGFVVIFRQTMHEAIIRAAEYFKETHHV